MFDLTRTSERTNAGFWHNSGVPAAGTAFTVLDPKAAFGSKFVGQSG